jgi:ATP-dependent protease ClpP protease subunit
MQGGLCNKSAAQDQHFVQGELANRKVETNLLPPNMAINPQSTVYVVFSAEINPGTTEALIGLLTQCCNQGTKDVYLIISTPGGAVMNGVHLYNVLRALPITLTTHNSGNVDSIGNAIFLAGSRRYAAPHSTFMFHGVGMAVNAGTRLEEKPLRETLASILADQKRIGAIFQERTQLTADQVEGLFRDAQTKDATFAAGCGIVDEVRDIQIPAGATVVSLVFQR